MSKKVTSLEEIVIATEMFLKDTSVSYASQLGNFYPLSYHISLSPRSPVCEIHEAPVCLIQQFYVDKNKSRHKENVFCLKKNVRNECIDEIILLNERKYSKKELGVESSKIKQIIINERLSYAKAFEISATFKNKYVVLANLDIFFDKSLDQVKRAGLEKNKAVFCQLRHEYIYNKPLANARLFGPRPDSQDAWIWHSSSNIGRGKFNRLTNFNLGMPGCDNKIIYLFFLMGFKCYNDPLRIKIYHHHSSQVRSYSQCDKIPKPYFAIHPVIDNNTQINEQFNTLAENRNLASYITNKFNKNENFIIPRIAGIENVVAMEGYHLQFIERSASAKRTIDLTKHIMKTNAGICLSDLGSAEQYSREYLRAFGMCDVFFGWEPWSCVTAAYNGFHGISQEFIMETYNKKIVDAKTLDIYNFIYGTPWTHALRGKRILIISPFIESIQTQLDRKIYETDVFLENTFVFLKPPQTHGHNPPILFSKAYKLFVEEINAIKDTFDIALCSCGGYGNPICAAIYNMGKSAIYVGGVLQMYFGIYGTRWLREAPDIIRLHMNMNWTRPSDSEKPTGFKNIENSCYW